MPSPKPLSKDQIKAAQAKTQSNMAAARYLHVSYQHYKRYAKMYNLFDSHKNQAASSFDPNKIKYVLIEQGYLQEECAVCKFKERRVLDYKVPLLLHFKDKNSNNYSLDNIQLLCYNHYFLQVGDIFNKQDEKQIESQQEHNGTSEKIEFEVDDYHLQRLKELGLGDDEEDDVNQYISRI
jgi:hypothetical protein